MVPELRLPLVGWLVENSPPLRKNRFWHQVKQGSMYILQVPGSEERWGCDIWRLLGVLVFVGETGSESGVWGLD